MAGRKKKLRYSEETLWFPEYYIGWIGSGNCDQETSSKHGIKSPILLTSPAIQVHIFSEGLQKFEKKNPQFGLILLRNVPKKCRNLMVAHCFHKTQQFPSST